MDHHFYRVPPEVWTLIFGWLEDNPKDLKETYNATKSGRWHDILREKRTKFLFSMTYPFLVPYLRENVKDLVVLRQVCKTWKNCVDHYFQLWFHYSVLPVTTLTHRLSPLEPVKHQSQEPIVGTTFSNSREIDRFMEQMEGYQGNPFLGKTVIIKVSQEYMPPPSAVLLKVSEETDSDNEGGGEGDLNALLQRELALVRQRHSDADLHKRFSALIRKFGEHIWACVYDAESNTPDANNEMQNIFKYLPNLRCLTIHMPDNLLLEGNEQDGMEWTRTIVLPDLPHLQYLNVLYNSKDLFNLLIPRYGPQLINCQTATDWLCPYQNEGRPRSNDMFQNLKVLKVVDLLGDSRAILQTLSQIPLPQLETLHLVYNEMLPSAHGLKTILNYVTSVSSTLTDFGMPLGSISKITDANRCRLFLTKKQEMRFPRITRLAVPHTYIAQDMLSLMLKLFPNVEHLRLHSFDENDENDEDNHSEGLRVREKAAQTQANIRKAQAETDPLWDQHKSLQKITVLEDKPGDFSVQFTRKMWEYRQVNAN